MSRYRRPYGRPRRRTRKGNAGSFRSILLTIFLFSVLGMLVVWLQKRTPPGEVLNGPVYVIDGDTVIMGKTHIRLKGMDAPEMEQQCIRAGQSHDCGREARNILRAKIGKSAIRCEKEGRDQYMRELARCYLGETELNRWMVEQGWAVSYGDYQREESDARRNRLGIWEGRFERPSVWRKEHRNQEDDQISHRAPRNDAISSAIIYIGERIRAFFETIMPRN